ncbi:hypothetical protein LCI18_009516 [Fusarium solani-melongenae]|uniref:Uncharacterized protein n=1 Tax=Fusarium solani subsp. cucurbitae TaxID=2747967 RepID=A0ACD3ZBS2_FUSSC|nr:hypothetical protein LCI18_009516 [Fusarium solani-melongenae]
MLRSSTRRYVCRNCICHGRNGPGSSLPLLVHSLSTAQKYSTTTQRLQNGLGPANIPKSNPQPPLPSSLQKQGPIRKRLQGWVPEEDERITQLVPDMTFWSKVTNSNTRPQSTGSTEMDHFKSDAAGMTETDEAFNNEDVELAIVGTKTRTPGDLVEMKQPGSRTPLFGIYLGYFGSRHHFYTNTGKWVISLGFNALFTISKFVPANDLKPILALIPRDVTPDDFEELRREDKGPGREAGADLIQKMRAFTLEADKAYQASLNSLDRARSLVSDGKRTKYLSLFELADILLPQSLKKGKRFSPAALYAVHTALYRNDFIFRPLSPSADCHRRDHLFEIFPYQDLMMINRVSLMVRDYTMTRGRNLKPPTDEELAWTGFGSFVLKAREVVLANRQKRSWTPYGVLAPSPGVTIETAEWSRKQLDFIRFLEWWASYDLFEDSSRFHADGSLILRALNLYDNATLDQRTAWTFLQELGMIPPWEIPSRYKVRFPGVKIEGGGGLQREVPARLEDSTRPDIAEGSRRPWTDDMVFCIDAPETMLIDDGVSLERTEKPDEFWIHVHTADPASGIKPNSELGKFLELIPENIYLPGHFQAMLPADISLDQSGDYKSESLVDQYSLAAGRPALTFSARVNEKGDLLDYKVEPGTLHKVTYLDPKDVSKFCNEPSPPPASDKSLAVGQLPDKAKTMPNRPMMSAKDLDGKSKEDLLTLYRLAEAIRGKRLNKGAWPSFLPGASVTVAFEDVPMSHTAGTKVLPPDPYIKIGYDSFNGASVVSNTMVLAGEIAARWCSDRKIPVPYRRDVHSKDNFEAIYNYATKELYPPLERGVQPSLAQRQQLSRLTGGIEMSTEPGPYFMLGLDMYAKATSPLRRFSDLVLHWQVHAALAHEREVKRRIDPEVDDLNGILPFTVDTLPNTISLLHMREKMARTVSQGTKEWMLMALVRAWKFEKTIPQRMGFKVESRWRQGVLGKLDLFDLDAIMTVDGIDKLMLVKDIKVGDQFDVELCDINVHSRQIFVKALKHNGQGQSESQPAHSPGPTP